MGEMNQKRGIRVGAVVGTVLLIVPLVWFFTHPDLFHVTNVAADGTEVVSFSIKRIAIMAILAVLGLGALWAPFSLPEKWKKPVGIVGFFATGIIIVFVLEYANIRAHRAPWWVVRSIGWEKLFLTWIVVFLFALWFALLANSWQMASCLTAGTVCVFGVICYFVYALRGEAFLASDLTVLQTAANVAGGYEYNIDFHTLILVMFTIAWCDLILWTGKTRVFRAWRWRGIALVIALGLTIFAERIYLHTNLLREWNVTLNNFRPEKSYGANGSILTFLRSAQLMIVEEPEGYSVARVNEIQETYMKAEPSALQEKTTETESEAAKGSTGKSEAAKGSTGESEAAKENTGTAEAAKQNAEKAAADGKPFQPNVIFVMDEAFTDMQAYMDFETDKEVCPFFSGLKENTIRGLLYVSSYGGRTANTEYEVLTGDSVGFVPPSSTPYQLYIDSPMPNLDAALENQGYRHTVGMHPYRPSGYNRENVYRLFGFDHLIFLDQFPDAELIYGKVSDDADVDRIITEYEAAKLESDAPFFVYNVTMQNHSPYTWNIEELPEEDRVHVTGGTKDCPEADLYLSLAHKSDQALEKLVGYFEQTDDPTVIVFFGDHQPSLPNSFYKMVYGKTKGEMDGEDRMRLYHSNYIIWANFDIEEQETDLSANYLSPVLKQAAGMELTGYDRFLLSLREELPIVTLNGYWDKDGTFYEQLEDRSSPWYDRLQEYDMLVYNHLFDEKNRNDEFYGGSVPQP